MSDIQPGQTLGQYQIIEQLGIGGMATVYKAFQPRMERYVAIKVLPRHFAQDPTFTGRFDQEAKTIAQLEHARILPVHDYGEEDGITYIVMRYLDAGTLAGLIKEGAVDVEEAARIVGQIAEGLDYAHSKGVLHRDVKPSNILLDGSGDVYITDFGISKLVEGTAQFTATGGLIGTPAYVSPEQGMGQPVDHRSDIYSLGVVLYEMVTGRTPFEAETPMAVVIKHINEPLPLPRSINPGLTESVERVILKALAKNPDDRYQTCGELADALYEAVMEAAPHRKPTEPSAPTSVLEEEAVETAPAFAAADVDAGTIPVAQPAPETKRKRGRMVPVVIVGVVLGLGLLAAIILLGLKLLGGKAPAAATEPTSPPVVEQAPPAEEATRPPEEEQPLGKVPRTSCAFDEVEVFYTNFGPDGPRFDLPPGAEIVPFGEERHALVIDSEPLVVVRFGPELAESTFTAMINVPPEKDQTQVLMFSQMTPEHHDGYYFSFGPGQNVGVWRDGEPIEAPPAPFPLNDGQTHALMLHVEGTRLEVQIDGQKLVEQEFDAPLPPGNFAIEAGQGVVRVDEVLICAYPKEGEPGAAEVTPVFSDRFDGDALDLDMWQWNNEPAGQWELAEGHLIIPALSGTAVMPDIDPLKASTMPMLFLKKGLPEEEIVGGKVDVFFTPSENYQAAGLVVVSKLGEPLFTLARTYCVGGNNCQGDAIYFDNWTLLAQNYDDYRPFVAGAGELPVDSPVQLGLRILPHELAGFYRLAGEKEWREVGRWKLLVDRRVGSIGIGTSTGGQSVNEIPAFFDNFVLVIGDKLPE